MEQVSQLKIKEKGESFACVASVGAGLSFC